MEITGIPFILTDWSQVERTDRVRQVQPFGEHGISKGSAFAWSSTLPVIGQTTGAAKGTSCYASKANSILNSKAVAVSL